MSLPLAAKIGIGAAGLLGLLAFTHSSSASPGSGSAVQGLPPELLAKVNAALQAADPDKLRVLAAQIRALGYTDQADSLLTAAANIDAAIVGTTTVKPAEPKVGTPIRTSTDQKARDLAGRVALALSGVSPGQEDKSAVAGFQAQEQTRGYYSGALDSLYGPKSARAFAQDHGIVPPRPLYWPKANANQAKGDYKGFLRQIAAKDLPRREEWLAAAAQIT